MEGVMFGISRDLLLQFHVAISLVGIATGRRRSTRCFGGFRRSALR
jgi:hypothetical protein